MGRKRYLGVDLSTQSIKVVIINEDYEIKYIRSIQFDDEFPSYNTKGGVHIQEDNKTVTSPTYMWVESFFRILDLMKNEDNVKFHKISAISGSGQQHGSVFWSSDSIEEIYNWIEGNKEEKKPKIFTEENSPIWRDSSTTFECKKMIEKLPEEVWYQKTGSIPFERFTGIFFYSHYFFLVDKLICLI